VRLTMDTRDEILRTMAGAYRKATKKEKGRTEPCRGSRRLQQGLCLPPAVSVREVLQQVWESLNPANLKRGIDRLKGKLAQFHK